MATRFRVEHFSRVLYCPVTDTFFHDMMIAEAGWQPTTAKQLSRYPKLRDLDLEAAQRAMATHNFWNVGIADDDRAAIAFCSNVSLFSPSRARALYDAVADLRGRKVPLACVVSDISQPGARLALPTQVVAADLPLLAFVATSLICSMDWSDDGNYDPFVVDVYDETATRLLVRLDKDGGTVE